MKSKLPPVLPLLLAALLGISSAHALDWGADGLGGSGTWDTTAMNWFNGNTTVQWVNGGPAVFTGTAGTVTLGTGVTAESLLFSVPSYIIQSSNLTLTGAATITTEFGVGINSALLGSSGLTKLGTGTLTLGSSANAYTGLTTIGAGALQIGNPGGGGGVLPGDVLNDSLLIFSRSSAYTYAGAISGTGSIIKQAAGTLTLTGNNTYQGSTTIAEGTLIYGNASSLAGSGDNILVSGGAAVAFGFAPLDQTLLGRVSTFSDGAIAMGSSTSNNLDFSAANLTAASLGATGAYTYSGTLTPAGNAYRLGGGGGVLTMVNALSGANSLVKSGDGAVVLSVANSYTEGTTLNRGILAIGDNGALGSGNVTYAAGAVGASLAANGSPRTLSNAVTMDATTSANNGIAGKQDFTFAGAVSMMPADGANNVTYITTTNTGVTKFSGGINFTTINQTASPSLAFAGTGDVLVDSPMTSSTAATANGVARNVQSFLVGSTLTIAAANSWGNGNSLLRTFAGSTVKIATSSATWNGTVPNIPGTGKQLAFAPYSGGRIIYDLNPVADGTAIVANGIYNVGGTFELVGKSTGTSSLTLAASFFVDLIGSTTITVNPNGGAGTTLLLGAGALPMVGGQPTGWRVDARTNGVGSSTLIDVSAVGSTVKSGYNVPLLLKNGLGSWNVVLKDTSGEIGYATTAADVAGAEIIRYTGATPLAPNSSNLSMNYVTSGNLTLDASVNPSYNTLQIDTTGGGTLDLNGNLVNSQSMLVTGGGDYLIQNGRLTGNQTNSSFGGRRTALLMHYGTGLLTYSGTIEGDVGFTKTGPGTVAMTGNNTYTGTTIISGGALRVSPNALSATSTVILGGGVLETSGTIIRTVGNTTGIGVLGWGTGVLHASGGFAGYSTAPDPSTDPLIIRLNNGNTSINWSASTSPAFIADGAALLLNSATANTMVDYQNGLGLGGTTAIVRIIDVADNPNLTTDFARISGVISGTTNPLHKQGAGLLELTGANTYTTSTTISGGTVSVTSLANGGLTSNLGASSNSASSLVFDGGALLYKGAGGNTDRLFTVTTDGGKIESSGTGALVFSNTGAMGLDAFNSAASFGARILTLGGNSTANNTLAAAIGEQGGETSLVKEGAGTWLLSGTNTYTGDTTVEAGILLVPSAGSLNVASDITVNASATFGGAGTVGDVLTETFGTLLLQSDVADANGLSAVSVTMDENSSMTFTLGALNGMLTTTDFLHGGGFTHINLKFNYSGGLVFGQTITLVDYATTNFITANTSQFVVSNIGSVPLQGTLFWDTEDGALKFTAIPEPSMLGFLGLGALFWAAWKRRSSPSLPPS